VGICHIIEQKGSGLKFSINIERLSISFEISQLIYWSSLILLAGNKSQIYYLPIKRKGSICDIFALSILQDSAAGVVGLRSGREIGEPGREQRLLYSL
jgi:hypothetical protein